MSGFHASRTRKCVRVVRGATSNRPKKMCSREQVGKRQLPPLPPAQDANHERRRCPVTNQCVPRDIITIDHEVYEHLGPLHRATADILVSKGKLQVVGGQGEQIPTRAGGA